MDWRAVSISTVFLILFSSCGQCDDLQKMHPNMHSLENMIALPVDDDVRKEKFADSSDFDESNISDLDLSELDKKNSLFRFGKRGSVFRFGKRGIFRFGKRGTIFRFGRSGLYDPSMEPKRTVFRYGKRNDGFDDYGDEDKRNSFFRYGRSFFRYGRSADKRPHTPFRFGREEDQ